MPETSSITEVEGQARQGFIYTPHYAASKFGVVGQQDTPGTGRD